MSILLFLFIVWAYYFASLFMHSFFLHRYFTHAQFSMSKNWEKFFYVMTWLLQGSAFLEPEPYRKLHLHHHAHSDKPGDPHSPWNFANIIEMTLRTKDIFIEIKYGTNEIARLYKDRELPRWPHFIQFSNSQFSMFLFLVLYLLFYIFCAPAWWCWIFFPITLLSGPIQGAVINWFGHKYGYVNYELDDKSRNTPILGSFTIGECYQNNHHAEPLNPNFGRKWHEFDAAYQLIRLFNWMGIITIQKAA